MGMVKIGVTGGIGSGKSTVCDWFSKMGIPVYQADTRAKQIIENQLKPYIIELLGAEAFFDDGSYNRAWVSQKVFAQNDLLNRLNALVHPAVKMDFELWAKNQNQAPYVLKEAALLFETGSYRELDAIILVVADTDKRIERIKKRDNRSEEQIRAIISKQADDAAKQKIANYIIENSHDQSLKEQVERIDQLIRKDFSISAEAQNPA
jgi:dephospho-CoA kinase